MAYLNKVMLIGNIGKDPEFRMSMNGGRKYVSFSLAATRRYRDNNGEQKEQTTWHNIIGWGKTADIMEQLGIRKGITIYVEGSVQNRTWNDQASGQKRYVTEINMDSFQVLTPRNSQQQQPTSYDQHNPHAAMTQQGLQAEQGGGYQSGPDDDLPF